MNEALEEIYKKINRIEVLKDLEPTTRGNYIGLKCPSCGKKEAYIYKNGINVICNRENHCGYNKTIWDYVQEKEGLDQQGTLIKLSEFAGVELTEEGEKKEYSYKQDINKTEILKKATQYMQELLFSEEGKETLNYLINRGYTEKEIKKAGFGHYPSINKLKNYIGGDLSLVMNDKYSIFSPKELGDTHTLTIPLRNEWGNIEGFIVRSVLTNKELKDRNIQKYKVNYGVKRGKALFNYKAIERDSKLVIVEGYIDALICEVKGIKGVVATGGAKIPEDQLKHAISRGITQFVIGLDQEDKAGEDGTERAIKLINDLGGKSYILSLPDGYKDPDELLRSGDNGVDLLKEAINNARSSSRWAGEYLIKKHGDITDITRDKIIEEALESSSKFKNIVDTMDYIETVSKGLGIPAKAFEFFQEEYNKKLEKEAKNKLYKEFIKKATQLEKEERIEELDKLLREQGDKITNTSISKLIKPYSIEDFEREVKESPEGLKTGYKQLDNYIAIPQGAITLVAGRPSHGKTTLLSNMFLSMINEYPEDSFYFFSYEETKQALTLNMITIKANHIVNTNKNKEAIRQYLKSGRDLNGDIISKIETAKRNIGELMANGNLQLFEESLDAQTLSNLIISEKRRNPKLKAVFIDYIQKIKSSEKGSNTRQVQLAGISEIMRETATKTNLPIILGAQLGRPNKGKSASEDTKSGIRLDNLREAGDLEQDANLVLGIFNEAMHQSELNEDYQIDPNKQDLKVIILKSRSFGNVGRLVNMELKGATLNITEKERARL